MARPFRWKLAGTVWLALALAAVNTLPAQAPPVHYQHHAGMPPGAIGSWQLQRGGPLAGYYQPVQFRLPSGAKVGLAAGGQFTPGQDSITAGFLIGQVYRLRVTDIPNFEGEEVYPTLEVIDRTYPPPGFEARYPIVIEIAYDDLRLALSGRFVTRVIYVENPQAAFPVGENPRAQEWFDVRPGDDPLQIADALGRPVAILRMGGRTPTNTAAPDMRFLYGCPPILPLPQVPPPPETVAPPAKVPQEPVPNGNHGANAAEVSPPIYGRNALPSEGRSMNIPGLREEPAERVRQRTLPWQGAHSSSPGELNALLPVQFQRDPRILR